MIAKVAEAETAPVALRESTVRTKILFVAAVEPVTRELESGGIAKTAEIVGTETPGTEDAPAIMTETMTATMAADMKTPGGREATVGTVGAVVIVIVVTADMIGGPQGMMIIPRRIETEDEIETVMPRGTWEGTTAIVTRDPEVAAKKVPAGAIAIVTAEVPNGEDRKFCIFVSM